MIPNIKLSYEFIYDYKSTQLLLLPLIVYILYYLSRVQQLILVGLSSRINKNVGEYLKM